ncbi:putative O-glycosylation ligase, exosortase A system-associated [Massilia glaciei]|uniref:Putative O-glycosylation ligase, exosortase A system-associated n=2 Tax=Massilia glaciei TaxID=1524097 RepID=A0A2U2HJS2_9BURK|nr:putative O-glycosylation ligase, exosortase A system-associated [Massilia glaciei]
MRDILVTLIVLGSLPLILRSPVNGALMWVWISVMNPHTQGWGFATAFPFAMVIALTTLLSLAFTREPRAMPWTPVTLTLLAFVVWMNVTLPFSIFLDDSIRQWQKVMKIMLMTFVCIMLIKSRRDVHRLVWVLAISLGYYGIKGGIFTLRNGGGERVWGPEQTFIGDNNAIALALIMIIPLMFHLRQNSPQRWLRRGLDGAMLLCALAALGSYSRGGLLAIAAMVLYWWLKSGKKAVMGGVLLCAAPLLLLFMPEQWGDRMDSIQNYDMDASAQGRINAWRMAWNLARDRLFGGGFEISDATVFAIYAANPNAVHAAHSIYFQVLGEHGFIGLGLYLLLNWSTWRSASVIIRRAAGHAELDWAASLAAMTQISLVGFAVGGAFLSLLYFDVPYYLMGAIVATRVLVERQLASAKA